VAVSIYIRDVKPSKMKRIRTCCGSALSGSAYVLVEAKILVGGICIVRELTRIFWRTELRSASCSRQRVTNKNKKDRSDKESDLLSRRNGNACSGAWYQGSSETPRMVSKPAKPLVSASLLRVVSSIASWLQIKSLRKRLAKAVHRVLLMGRDPMKRNEGRIEGARGREEQLRI
jgi:hypothetical protein